MSLKKLLRIFCTDTYNKLVEMRELPRPPYDSPLIARNPLYTVRLSEMDSYKNLQQYMRTSGLQKKLHDVGHTWLWHEEVFEWLFLEQVIAESSSTTLDGRVFDRVFKRAQAELLRTSFRFRRILVLNGVPDLKRPIKLSPGVYLAPIDFSVHHYRLADLLGWRYQYRHRAPVFWIDPDSRLLIQTRRITKGDDGKYLRDSREEMRYEAEQAVKTLKISLDTPIFCKQIFSSYLSGFPLLPIGHVELEEYSGFSVSVNRPIKRMEILDISTCFNFLTQSKFGTEGEPKFFQSSVSRFTDSFRFIHLEQSIVDLIVALEALIPVGDELRYRLATNCSFLLGTDEKRREQLYRRIKAAYRLRNTIVHGRQNYEDDVVKALKEFFPELKTKPNSEVLKRIDGAVTALQNVVRLILRAYIYMRHNHTRDEWLDTDDFECLPFDSQKRLLIQTQLGINRRVI